ncbi:MAG TPA: AtpZ/AtpI family protein [Pyrinomonadaceae bacterium]|jgi:ATP synthase protein I
MPKDDDKDVNRRSAVMYSAALSIFFSVLVGFGVGWALDKWLGTTPWMVVGGIVTGSALGFYEFIRLTSKLD